MKRWLHRCEELCIRSYVCNVGCASIALGMTDCSCISLMRRARLPNPVQDRSISIYCALTCSLRLLVPAAQVIASAVYYLITIRHWFYIQHSHKQTCRGRT